MDNQRPHPPLEVPVMGPIAALVLSLALAVAGFLLRRRA